MRVVINGIEHENPTEIAVYCDEEGETLDSVRFTFHGGKLTIPNGVYLIGNEGESSWPFLHLGSPSLGYQLP